MADLGSIVMGFGAVAVNELIVDPTGDVAVSMPSKKPFILGEVVGNLGGGYVFFETSSDNGVTWVKQIATNGASFTGVQGLTATLARARFKKGLGSPSGLRIRIWQ